jgi:hypothetical protein
MKVVSTVIMNIDMDRVTRTSLFLELLPFQSGYLMDISRCIDQLRSPPTTDVRTKADHPGGQI